MSGATFGVSDAVGFSDYIAPNRTEYSGVREVSSYATGAAGLAKGLLRSSGRATALEFQASAPVVRGTSSFARSTSFVPRAAVAEAEGFIGPTIGRSGYRTMAEFSDAVATRYQSAYDRAFQLAQSRAAAGRIAGDQTTLGRFTDAIARRDVRRWLAGSEGINEGPGRIIQVNRWLRDPAGSGAYRIPDVRIPGVRLSLDGTIGWKGPTTPQLVDIRAFSGDNILIVRPTQIGGSYGVYFP